MRLGVISSRTLEYHALWFQALAKRVDLHRESSTHSILAAAGGGRAFAFDSSHELASLKAPLSEALRRLACAPELLGAADPVAYAPYQANAVARRFGIIFDRLAAERSG